MSRYLGLAGAVRVSSPPAEWMGLHRYIVRLAVHGLAVLLVKQNTAEGDGHVHRKCICLCVEMSRALFSMTIPSVHLVACLLFGVPGSVCSWCWRHQTLSFPLPQWVGASLSIFNSVSHILIYYSIKKQKSASLKINFSRLSEIG